MRFLSAIFIYFLFTLIFEIPVNGSVYGKFDRIPNIDVKNYSLKWKIYDISEPSFEAIERITLCTLLDSKFVDLHIETESIWVSSITTESNMPVPFKIIFGGLNGDLTNTLIRIMPYFPFRAMVYRTFIIKYSIRNKVQEDGCYPDNSLFTCFPQNPGGRIMTTQNWPYYARNFIISNDHPSDPATFDIELHVPKDMVAASIGKLTDKYYAPNSGLRVFKWRHRLPTTTYGFHVSIGDLDIVNERLDLLYNDATKPLELMIFFPKYFSIDVRNEYIRSIQKGLKALFLFSSLLGKYPYEKVGFDIVPHPFSMEYPSLITLEVPGAAVHEVAHQWWGNSLMVKEWEDLWISEGFATYFAGLFDEIESGKNSSCIMKKQGINKFASSDPLHFIRETYCTGAAALAELRERIAKVLGLNPESSEARNIFIKLMSDLYQKYRFQNLDTAMLVDHITKRTSAIIRASGYYHFDSTALYKTLNEWKGYWFVLSFDEVITGDSVRFDYGENENQFKDVPK